MTEISKYENILKERNSLISHYKEKCDGLLELKGLLEGLIYCLISNLGEAVIKKELLKSSVNKSAISFWQDSENYYLSCIDESISPSAGDENGETEA